MKAIKYYGQTIKVPSWARYITTDANGKVFVRQKKPKWMGALLGVSYHEWLLNFGKPWSINFTFCTTMPKGKPRGRNTLMVLPL